MLIESRLACMLASVPHTNCVRSFRAAAAWSVLLHRAMGYLQDVKG